LGKENASKEKVGRGRQEETQRSLGKGREEEEGSEGSEEA